MKYRLCVGLLLAIVLGCSAATRVEEGSEQAAREYFAAEFDKWMANQESEAMTMRGVILAPPVGYQFRSVVAEEGELGSWTTGTDVKTVVDYASWPAYRFNVYIDWKSKADTPLETVTTYNLTWNPREKKWYVCERL